MITILITYFTMKLFDLYCRPTVTIIYLYYDDVLCVSNERLTETDEESWA